MITMGVIQENFRREKNMYVFILIKVRSMGKWAPLGFFRGIARTENLVLYDYVSERNEILYKSQEDMKPELSGTL